MKKITLFIIGIVLSATILFAQTPNELSYQAVARTSAGLIMENQAISIEISIMESGSAVYTETHSLSTNEFGLFTLNIGGGISTLGDFSTINWANGSYGIQVAMDENGGNSFVIMGISPLLTVPFAMHAKTAENTFSGNYSDLSGAPDLSNYDNDVTDDFSGDYTELSNKPILGGDVSGDIDFNTVERIQGRNVSSNEPANGQILKWDDGLFQWVPSDDALGAAGSTDGVVSSMGVTGSTTKIITLNRTEGLGTLSANFTDENTQLSEAEVDSYVSNNGYLTSFTEVDGSTTNEIQDLTFTGTTLSIENGNSVNLSSLQDGYEADTDTHLSEAEVDSYVSNNGYLTSFTEVDGSTTNEIQDLTFTGTTLSIENGNSVNLSSLQDGYEADTDTHLSEAEVDSYVSNNGYLTSFTEVDGSTTNELQSLSFNGAALTISNGNSVNLTSLADGFASAVGVTGTTTKTITIERTNGLSNITASFTDNNTQLTESEVDAMVSNNGYLTTEIDGSTSNELQDLSLSGSTLSIQNGNSVDLSGINGNSNLSDILTEGNNGGASQIKNIADPTEAQDAVTKAYVDLLEARIYALENPPTGTLEDIDGNTYNYITIGSQAWMTENLNVTHYPNGDAIPLVTSNPNWGNLEDYNISGAYSYYNNDSGGESATFGALYTYGAAIGKNWTKDNVENQGVCPDGWHLPTNTEWDELNTFLSTNVGSKLAGDAGFWQDGDLDQNADFGSTDFHALPSGQRSNTDGQFAYKNSRCLLWSASESTSGQSYTRRFHYNGTSLQTISKYKSTGVSVRCIRN